MRLSTTAEAACVLRQQWRWGMGKAEGRPDHGAGYAPHMKRKLGWPGLEPSPWAPLTEMKMGWDGGLLVRIM